jgi:hypothetical protein
MSKRIIVYITLESNWVDVLTSHNEDESKIAPQLVLFDLISFIDDSFHLARQASEKFLNIRQRNSITPAKDMGHWI